jgi:hypothetical protein
MKVFPIRRMERHCVEQLLPYSVIIAVGTLIIRLYQDETHAGACV